MNLIDLFIIYLACGAPFGVYYFLKHRAQSEWRVLWLKSLLNFLFWMPLAFRLARQNFRFRDYIADFDQMSVMDSVQDARRALLQKNIERILIDSQLNTSIYDYRETVERYIGLTAAERIGTRKIAEHEREFFRLAPLGNAELGAICLNRRNRQRLAFHQTAAREDFLHLISRLSKATSDRNKLEHLSIALTELIKDFETRRQLEKMFADSPQTAGRAAVKNAEQDLWKPEIHKPSTAQPISHLRAVQATMNLRGKD